MKTICRGCGKSIVEVVAPLTGKMILLEDEQINMYILERGRRPASVKGRLVSGKRLHLCPQAGAIEDFMD